MSKILQAGETGFGILIEHDAGYINTDLNPQFLNEGLELKPNEPVLINCILQKWGVRNKNGRTYPKDVTDSEDKSEPYFIGINEFNSISKSYDTKTGRYTSNFQLSFSLNPKSNKQ